MTIELTKEQERTFDLAVASGAYRNFDEVIDAAIAMHRLQCRFNATGHDFKPLTKT